MNASVRAVAGALVAATALIAIMLTPMATGVSQAGGMHASGGAMRSSGGMGTGRALGAPGTSAGMPGVRVRATAGGGVTVRSMPTEGAFAPPLNFAVRPLTPGTIIIPATGNIFFPGGVISPLIPGTVVNPLLPGTIFVPLFPTTTFFPTFANNVFVTVFPSTIISPFFQGTTIVPISSAAIGFSFAPSLITPLTPGIVPPLVPQFVVIQPHVPLVQEPSEANTTAQSAKAGIPAGPAQVRRAGAKAAVPAGAAARSAPVVRVSAGMMQAAPQASEAPALQEWVRTQNAMARPAGPEFGISSQSVPGSASSSDRKAANSGSDPAAIESAFGRPTHRVAFVPRTVFFDDFFAISDGRLGFKQFKHHPVVTGDYYYPAYVSDPAWFAFNHPGEYPSVYALWGWTPPWVSSDRMSIMPPNGMGGSSYWDSSESAGGVDVVGAWNSIGGIRSAWLTGDPRRLAPYLSSRQEIGVYFNGKYAYSAPARDFYGMTVDAMGAARTTTVQLDNPVWLSAGDVVVTGRNAFRDPEGNLKTIYVSYRVRKLGAGWYITDFGSSLEPIGVESGEFAS